MPRENTFFCQWLEKAYASCFFKMDYTFYGQAPSYWSLSNRAIKEFHMVLILDGKGTYFFSDEAVELMPGRLLFVCPEIRHSAVMDEKHRLKFATSRFDLYQHGTDKVEPAGDVNFYTYLDAGNLRLYSQLFERLFFHYTTMASVHNGLSCSGILQQIVSEMSLELQYPQHYCNDGIEQIRLFIWDNPQDRSSMSELAKMAGLSLRHFNLKFRERTGYSPNGYRIMVRCEKAKQMLRESDMNIKEISYHLGYPNQYSFSLQFSRFTGGSPCKYRNNLFDKK